MPRCIYLVRDLFASVVRPVKELKGFQKIVLVLREEGMVTFEITEKELIFLTENNIWESEAGEFEVFIGADSSTTNSIKFRLL